MRRREKLKLKEENIALGRGASLQSLRNNGIGMHEYDEVKKKRPSRAQSIVRMRRHFRARYFGKSLQVVANASLALCAAAICIIYVVTRSRAHWFQSTQVKRVSELLLMNFAADVNGTDLIDREEASPHEATVDVAPRAFHIPDQDVGEEPDEFLEALIEFDEKVASLQTIVSEALVSAGLPWVQSSGGSKDLLERSFDRSRNRKRSKFRYEFQEMEFEYDPHDYYRYNSDDFDPYLAFDDDEGGRWAGDEYYLEGCRRTAINQLLHPTCNTLHELDLLHEESAFLGEGEYRGAFRVPASPMFALGQHEADGAGEITSFTFKSIVLSDDYHDYFTEHMEMQRLDALVMSLLHESPRVADIYGHCAMAQMSEYTPIDVESIIIPTGGDQPPNTAGELRSENNLSISEKLQLALEMAQPIAEMHGFEGGVIMHVDITQPNQFRRGADGVLKIIDFNRAEVLLFNEEEDEYCAMKEGASASVYRAPEEIVNDPINEKSDVYNYGSMVYMILTGLWIHTDMQDDDKIQAHILDGGKPFVDERYMLRSFGEAALVRVMDRCWTFNPDERPDIFWVIQYLENAIKTNAWVESRGASRDEWIEYV